MSGDNYANLALKLNEAKKHFDKTTGLRVRDDIAGIKTGSLNINVLAVVLLMLMHNKVRKSQSKMNVAKNKSSRNIGIIPGNAPTLDDIETFDLDTIDVSTFDPYIEYIRNRKDNKKERKASEKIDPKQRQAKFVATFIIYLAFLKYNKPDMNKEPKEETD